MWKPRPYTGIEVEIEVEWGMGGYHRGASSSVCGGTPCLKGCYSRADGTYSPACTSRRPVLSEAASAACILWNQFPRLLNLALGLSGLSFRLLPLPLGSGQHPLSSLLL